MYKFDFWFLGIIFYIIMAFFMGWFLDDVTGLVPLADDDSPAKYVALMAFWPIFVIKFLAIGLWSVLYSFYYLIF